MKNILHTRLIRQKVNNVIKREEKLKYKLDSILEDKLTTVRGGAAVGKSTLISSFIEDKTNYMWFSLDESSDDLCSFWTYVFYGLEKDIDDIEFYIDRLNPLVKREDIFDIISSLINELVGRGELFIVLDDFQYIKDKFIIKTMEFFIENTSDNVHFIIISRSDIPIYLGHILMKSGVTDISGDDFKFSCDEIRQFIKANTNFELSDEFINEVYLKSEGWIGAVKLMLTACNKVKNINNIPRNNKLFIEYMNNEIIESLSEEEIEFLIETSPLNYVNIASYNKAFKKDGKAIMDQLLEKNMMITLLDEENEIYKYHNILREHLKELFNKYEASRKNDIITKLTQTLIQEEDYDEAMNIFISYQEFDEALKLLENDSQKLVGLKFLNAFPMDYYKKSIDLTMVTLFYNYLNFDYEKVDSIIDYVKQSSDDDKLKMCIEIYNVIIGRSDNISDLAVSDKIINGKYNILTKVIYGILKSCLYSAQGDCKKSLELVELTNKLSQELNNKNIYVINEYSRAIILEKMGKLYESEEVYDKLDQYLAHEKYSAMFDMFKSIGLPGSLIKQCRDKEAEKLLCHAEGVLKEYKDKEAFISNINNLYYNLAEVKYIQGDIDECKRLLDIIDENSRENKTHLCIVSLKMTLLSLENKISPAEYEEYVNLYNDTYNDEVSESNDIQIAYGIVLFMQKKYQECLEFFNKIIFIARKNRIVYILIYALLWKVILLNKFNNEAELKASNDEEIKSLEHNKREILNSLKEAIFYSRDEDILFPYYKNRNYLRDILKQYKSELLQDKNNKGFMDKLNLMINKKTKKAKDDLSYELTPREIEVLKCLAEGQSNKEIGEKLFITISTVKTHIINIYSKLNVKNRVEAVNLADRLLNSDKS